MADGGEEGPASGVEVEQSLTVASNTNSGDDTMDIDTDRIQGPVQQTEEQADSQKLKRKRSDSSSKDDSARSSSGNGQKEIAALTFDSGAANDLDAPPSILMDGDLASSTGDAAGMPSGSSESSSHSQARQDERASMGTTAEPPPPPGASELLEHLSRSIRNVVTAAFEKGILDGRANTKSTMNSNDHQTRRASEKNPIQRKTATRSRNGDDGNPGGNAGEGDDDDDDDGSGGDGDESPQDYYPKLRNKQRRRTGRREDGLNTFHVIREFLTTHNVYPPKNGSRPLPENVEDSILTRFQAEGKTAGPRIDDPDHPLRLNWDSSLVNDEWNIAAINLLAHQLQIHFTKLKDEIRVKVKPYRKDAETLRKHIVTRLMPIRTAIRKESARRNKDKVLARARMRRAARRKN
ncbi:hypothetical protein SCHPADRAFT_897473, partial [Schizopora paradoxa]